MRIALIVDNPYRDLPGMVLVATRLCQYGATCYLVPSNLAWREVGSLAPDFVLLTNLRRPRQEFARRLLGAGIKIGVLDTEGGVIPNLETYGKMTSPDPDVYGQVSCFCSWGPVIAEYARSQGWYRDSQLVVTGAPRFDFYADRWREAALRASREVGRFSTPIVLVNGSFPRANPGFLTPEREIQSWMALGFSREYMARYQAIETQAMRDLAAVANHVAARFPQATVVYRPHPFEKLETYRSLLEPRDNLHLLKVGTVDGWILRASAVIHRNSTTAIEAAASGRPALLPAWIPVPETLAAVDAVSVKCASFSDLDEQLNRCLAGQHENSPALDRAVADVIQKWFHRIDGASHERVADAVLSHAKDGSCPRIDAKICHGIHYAFEPSVMSARSYAAIALRMRLRVPATWSFSKWSHQDPGRAWALSEKSFDAARVQALTEAIDGEASRIVVGCARQDEDYRFGYRVGRSVVMRP